MSQKSKSKRKTPRQQGPPTTSPNPTPSEFSFAIARIAASQISQSVGFKATKPSAVETLAHIAIKYIEAIASASASYAAMANRTNTNVFDFTNALHDLQSVQGFKGASFLHKNGFCVLGSSVLTDLAKFVSWNEETPFARPIPRAEKLDTEKRIPFPVETDSGRDLHVPRWLPAFPDVKKTVTKRRNGEELWENMVAGNGGGGVMNESESERVSESGNWNGNGGNEKGFCLELGEEKKMGRVRFRIGLGVEEEEKGVAGLGLNLRSGVCRGGKRVCWNNNSKIGYNFDDDDDDDDDKR
ncbi:unnamed protein product [Prunus armeniaca]|uniref:Bromodomain associated domain-containing protein n=1 Tax=Prunus armeniaca TaxID=36596 RepID=A0A6J5UJH3_PRUAR|nr:unnamed protein product [Prunus armeniaca]